MAAKLELLPDASEILRAKERPAPGSRLGVRSRPAELRDERTDRRLARQLGHETGDPSDGPGRVRQSVNGEPATIEHAAPDRRRLAPPGRPRLL